MGNRRKQLRSKLRGDKDMHHATQKHDHYHAVMDTQWRSGETPVFAKEHRKEQLAVRSYQVTHKPVAESAQPMPAEVASQYPHLVELATLASPAAVARLEMLADRHPGTAVLNNLLAAAYSRQGRMKDALAVVQRNYEQSPEYLFARVQYAQLCLLANKPEAVPEIFDHHFDLKLLYPHRTKYHVSEFAAFASVVGEYHLLAGDYDAARGLCETLKHVAPDHELTARLQSLMGDGE
jgi:tetratricopeptide (TPR) repeat protein